MATCKKGGQCLSYRLLLIVLYGSAFCPKSPRPGVTRHGKPFDTCCRGCALGSCYPVLGLLSVWRLGLALPGLSMMHCVVGSTPQRQERVVVVMVALSWPCSRFEPQGAGNDSYTIIHPSFLVSLMLQLQVALPR